MHRRREGAEGAIRALGEVLSQDPSSLRARWLLNIAHMTLGSYPAGVPERYLVPPAVFASEYPLKPFDNVAEEAGLDLSGLAGGAILEDFDGDRRLDLVWSAMGFDEPMRFMRNQGDGTFRDRTREAGLAGLSGGLNMVPADYDNDGDVDVLVLRGGWLGSQGRFPLSLLRNEGGGRFSDVTKAAGLLRFAPTQTATFFDFDGDGRLDFYAGTGTPDLGMLVPNRMFRNDSGRRFQEVTTAGNFGHLQKGHAIAFGDYDNDGDQDVFEQMGGAYLGDKARSALYRNPGSAHAWLGLELEGVRSNRQGVGARLAITVDSPSGPRVIHRTVGSGGSFGGNPMRQEIGLGAATRVASVEILWPPTGQRQRVEGLKPGRRYRIREGTAKAEEVEWPRSLAPTARKAGLLRH